MNIDDRLRSASRELLLRTQNRTYTPVRSRRRAPRRVRVIAVALSAALAGWGVWALTGSQPAPQVNVAGVPTATDIAFNGSSVTSAVSWKGLVVAAGYVANQTCTRVGPRACPTVTALEPGHAAVWVSARPFDSWKRTWESPQPWAVDNGPSRAPIATAYQTLVPAGDTLYLFSTFFTAPSTNRWDTQLWSSTDATHWKTVELPPSLAGTQLLSAAYGHRKLIAIAGFPSPVRAWASTDGGKRWTSSIRGLGQTWMGSAPIIVTARGFLIGGSLADPASLPAVWSSIDGSNWAPTTVARVNGYVVRLATNGTNAVALVSLNSFGTADSVTGAFYVSKDDRSWVMAKPNTAAGTPPPAGRDVLTGGAHGYMAVVQYQPTLWASAATATRWTPYPMTGVNVPGFAVDDAVITPDDRVIVFGWSMSAFGDRPWVLKPPIRLDAGLTGGAASGARTPVGA